MTDEAMSPLRRRMIEDMTIRKLAAKTQQGYIRAIKDFAAFLGRSPDTASFEDVRRFQLHLAANGAHIPIVNHTVAALRFFFRITLRRSDKTHGDPRRTRQRSQRPLRDAVSASARTATRLVESRTTARLAVSRARPRAADDDAPAQSRLSCRSPKGRDQQARLVTHLTAQLRHPPARAEH